VSITDFLFLVLAAGVVIYLLRPTKKIETTQELLDYKDISPDGIIELPDNKYRLVIEVEPVNMALRSFEEQAAIWLGFKNMVNSINIPVTFLVQTRYLDLKDYLEGLRRFNSSRPDNIKSMAEEHIEYLARKTEGKHLRDRRYFIILKVDPASAGVESGIQVDNQLLDMVVKNIPSPQKSVISPAEIRKNAETELLEAASVIRGALDGIEIRSVQLDRKMVLEMLYQTFNRDLAPFARLEEADAREMFSLFAVSKTPETVLRRTA